MIASLVMPSYGQHMHIYDAVRSVIYQITKEDYELIIVLGGPEPESTAEVDRALDSYEGHCGVFVMHTPENTSAGDAINVGFARCNDTPYLAWVSSDNELRPNWLTKMAGYLDEHSEVDAVYSSYFRQSGFAVGKKWRATKSLAVRSPHVGLINNPNCYIGPSHLHTSQLWNRVGPHKDEHAHDYDWWLRAEETGTIDHLDEVLCTLRKHPDRANVRMKRDGAADGERWRQEALKRRA